MDALLYQGMQFAIRFELLNNGVAIPLTDISNIVVWVYPVSGNMLKKFSMVEKEGHDHTNFVVIDAPAGKFEVKMLKETTATAKEGDYIAEFSYEITSTGDRVTGAPKTFNLKAAKTGGIEL